MTLAELTAEMTKRQLSTAPLPGQRGDHKTRPPLIRAIKEDVELHVSNPTRDSTPSPSPEVVPTSSTSSRRR